MPAGTIDGGAIRDRFRPGRYPGVCTIGWAVARGTGELHERNPANNAHALLLEFRDCFTSPNGL